MTTAAPAIITPTHTINIWPLGLLVPEQGGYYAGIISGEDGQHSHHLFVSPHDASADNLAWGEYSKKIDGASFVNDGQANTAALVAEPGKSPAAEACIAYRGSGLDDWYLPAQAELNVCYANCRQHFNTVWHWSSTQYSANYAWMQNFDDGTQNYGHKGNVYRVRAVRRLTIY